MKGLIIIIISSIILIAFLTYNLFQNPEETLTAQVVSEKNNTNTLQQNIPQNEQTKNTKSPAAQAQENPDSPATDTINQAQKCFSQQISYSLYKFNKKETCLAYQNQLCIEKELICSASVQNLDYATSGIFQLDFILKDISTQQILQQTTLQSAIEPRQEKEFENTFQVAGKDV